MKIGIAHSFKLVSLVVAIVAMSGILLADDSSSQSKPSALEKLKYKVGDEVGNDRKALTAEMMIAHQEEKAIEQANKLLKKYRGTALEPDLLLRIAELHMRRAKTDRFLELHRKSEEVVTIAPKMVRQAASKKRVMQAIAIYDSLEKRFPHYEKIDVIIFNDAFASQQIGDFKKADRLFGRLVKEYPNSQLVPDAQLAIGESLFQQHDFKAALEHFTAIRQYPDSMVYPYGLYKSGWTRYNLRDAKGGLADLEDVIKYGRYVKEQNIDARLDLRKEALMDMALFFEDVYTAKEAYGYFSKQATELDVSPVILRLSELYKRHDRHQDIKVILSDYIRQNPKSSYIPIAYVDLMEASEKLKKQKDVITLLGDFYELCRPNGDWSKSQPQNIASNKEGPLYQFNEHEDTKITASDLCGNLFNKEALGYANKWLKIWQKDNSQTEWADATESAFSIYLQKQNNSDEVSKARFVYSELLFKRNKFRKASDQYALTAQYSKDEKIGHDARYFAIIALEKAVNDKWSDSDEKNLKALVADYLVKYPNGKYHVELEFKIGFIAYEKGRYDEAAKIFLSLGQKYPNAEKGLKSQDLYLDILNIKKDYKSLKEYSFALREKAKEPIRRDKLTKIYEEAYFSVIQDNEKKGDLNAAILGYNEFSVNNPNSKLTQSALWNTVQLDFKVGRSMAGAEAAVAYYNKYKGTKEGIDALLKAAQTYESMAQLQQAADVLTKLAVEDKDNKTKWNMLAADFYVLNNESTKAKGIYEAIHEKASGETAFHATEQLELMSKNSKNEKEHDRYLHEIAASGYQPQASLAAVQFVERAFNESKFDEAFNLAKKILAQEKSGAAKSALARARLTQARILRNEYKNQSLKSHLEKIQVVLMLKTDKLSKAQIAYQNAAAYGDPSTSVTAENELADCYLHYSEALRSMPIPTGVPEKEADAFKSEMEKLAIPMEEKGIETKVHAYQLAKTSGLNDEIVESLRREMKKLNQPVESQETTIVLQGAPLVLPKMTGVGS